MGRTSPVKRNQVYGKLIVLRVGYGAYCKCECGTYIKVEPRYLRNGTTTSCRSCALTSGGHVAGPLKVNDWIGSLQAVDKVGHRGRHLIWKFKCTCGRSITAVASDLKRCVGPTCGLCKVKKVYNAALSHPDFVDKTKMFYDFAKRDGFKLYDIAVSPPKLLYDPEV